MNYPYYCRVRAASFLIAEAMIRVPPFGRLGA